MDDTYNETERAMLEELEWVITQLKRDRLLKRIDEKMFKEMMEMFEKDRMMVIDRANGRRDEEKQWKRTDLTPIERRKLKHQMEKGEALDKKLVDILEMMREKRAEFLANWNNQMGLS